jgi:hypothetical protein
MKMKVEAEVTLTSMSVNFSSGAISALGTVTAMKRDDSPIHVQLSVPLNDEAFAEASKKMKNNEMDAPSLEVALAMMQSALARHYALTVKDE